jgi:hypothetical protein
LFSDRSMFSWVKVILPIAGGVATLCAVAHLLKLTSNQIKVVKLHHKNAEFKIQVAVPERIGVLRKKALFGWTAWWYADIGWECETVVIYFFHDAGMKKIARKLSLGRHVTKRILLVCPCRMLFTLIFRL